MTLNMDDAPPHTPSCRCPGTVRLVRDVRGRGRHDFFLARLRRRGRGRVLGGQVGADGPEDGVAGVGPVPVLAARANAAPAWPGTAGQGPFSWIRTGQALAGDGRGARGTEA